MRWFGVKEKVEARGKKPTAIEIVAHKTATDKVIKEAEDASKKLNKLLVENGFTIKIYLAAGGKLPAKKRKTT